MKKNSQNKILLVGGGTGGHVVPVYNIYQFLKKADPKLKVYIVGSGSAIEKQFFADSPNYFILKTGKFQRYLIVENIWQLALFIYGLVQALILLAKIRPKIIFAKGGFVSLPIIFWARILRIPYFVHESDAVMGRANKFAASGAKKVFTGFPAENYKSIEKKKLEFVGQIIDGEVEEPKSIKFDFGFANHNPVIFITGGSLGALNINRNIFLALPELLPKYNLVHQTGAKGFPEAIEVRAKLLESMKRSYFIADFLPAIDSDDKKSAAIQKADLIVARAGATTIAEIALAGKPMILIPYPYASGDHQARNAEILKRKKACDIITDRELNPDLLVRTMNKLFEDKSNMKEMAKSAKNFFPENALKVIGEEIINFLLEKRNQ
ncbi:MAG: UDP-N-acetylglucosamine--N-acetylmuramyl-(pentapeptide) pyrophosphoryl-undecaprenol N-acetylglucosamine transferase [bacterium]|nr:UDP-N-acetylglucosamine--N-acetylmuramyl-(pentapeptide) pyrophosphoryl-undecaprenol N-acetylglucosamine transferase [bacterium]